MKAESGITVETTYIYPCASAVLDLVARKRFREFNQGDWYAFAGCVSPNPLIYEGPDYVIVIDYDTILMVANGDMSGGQTYPIKKE